MIADLINALIILIIKFASKHRDKTMLEDLGVLLNKYSQIDCDTKEIIIDILKRLITKC